MHIISKLYTMMAVTVILLGSAAVLVDTAVAEPEDGPVAELNGTEYDTLQGALDAAKDGDTVRILRDIVVTGTDRGPGATIKTGVTLDGLKADGDVCRISTTTAKKTLDTLQDAKMGHEVVLKNLEIVNSSGVSGCRCLDTRGLESGLVLDNVYMTVDNGSGNTQPLNIGGYTTEVLDVTITDSRIVADGKSYAITTFNTVNLSIDNSYLEGWAVVYLKSPDNSHGSRDSTVDIRDSEIVSYNKNEGETDDFGAIVLEDPRITVRLTDITATISETTGKEQRLFLASEKDGKYSSESSSFYIGGEKTKVTFSGGKASLCDMYDSESVCQVSGGTFNIDISEYLEPGLEYEIDDDGNFVIVTDQPADEPSYNPDVDDDLPPFIPTQPAEDDSVTIVACAAAAVVAALMAVFLILTYRKD